MGQRLYGTASAPTAAFTRQDGHRQAGRPV